MDQTAKQQIVEKLKSATNILVTVSSDPTVDQLASAIGLTLMLNKLGKHATAVYSGDTPSTLEFLKPEANLHKNTDSLQDFIISLDRAKADKLRYKVEDDVVKIFITPYKTSLSPDDLNFSQGDFNIDAVVALGVDQREHLDQAIVAHGRILHDATVMTIVSGPAPSNIGSINWQDGESSSLSEMIAGISDAFQSGILDEQMSTAFLTGIVAQTERFKNPRTTPKVMTMAAQLMAAGANQQLIADSLDIPNNTPIDTPGLNDDDKDSAGGGSDSTDDEPESLKISHDEPVPEGPEKIDEPREDSAPEAKDQVSSQDELTQDAGEKLDKPKKPELVIDSETGKDVSYGSDGPEAEERSNADRDAEGIHIDENGQLMSHDEQSMFKTPKPEKKGQAIVEGPDKTPVGSSSHTAVDTGQSFVMGGKEKTIDPLPDMPDLKKPELPPIDEAPQDALGLGPRTVPEQTVSPQNPAGHKTLEEIDQAVGKTEPDVSVEASSLPPLPASIEEAREKINEAVASDVPNIPPQPAKALNALPLEGTDPLQLIEHKDQGPADSPPPLPPPPTNPAGPGLTLPKPE